MVDTIRLLSLLGASENKFDLNFEMLSLQKGTNNNKKTDNPLTDEGLVTPFRIL